MTTSDKIVVAACLFGLIGAAGMVAIIVSEWRQS